MVPANFEHLNLTARGKSVSPERPRSKREVIQFEESHIQASPTNFPLSPIRRPLQPPATIPIGCADRGTGVQVRNGGIIVDPPPAGLAVEEHAVIKHHAEPSGQRRYPACVC